jgi:anaerobic selenocysteine-containing dehydrogenase
LGGKGQHPAIDYDKTNLIFLVGYNILHTHPPIARKILDAKRRGAKLVVVDPMLSPTATKADIWLALRPGTDMALFLAMHHVIIRERLYDSEFLASWSNAPFLVRDDNGLFLREGEAYVVWEAIRKTSSRRSMASAAGKAGPDRLHVRERYPLQAGLAALFRDGRQVQPRVGGRDYLDPGRRYSDGRSALRHREAGQYGLV